MAKEAPMRVVAGADGFGSGLKDSLVAYLEEKGIEVEDLGVDKYYSIAVKVASELVKEKKSSFPGRPLSRGLLVCGTGVGVSIFANKFGGVYAAPCNSVDEALNARSINNTNVLTLGAKISSLEEGKKILDAWLETPFKAPCPASDGCPWNCEIDQFLDASIEEMGRISQAALENADAPVGSSISPVNKIGQVDKASPSPGPSVDLLNCLMETIVVGSSTDGVLGSNPHSEARAGVGLGLTAVRASVSDSGSRAGVGEGLTAIHAPVSSQLSTAISASEFELPGTTVVSGPDSKPSPEERADEEEKSESPGCAVCALASVRAFEDVSIMPGGSWSLVREDPTSAVVRFRAGSVEPAHHHTFGHDLIVMSGKKTVWNLSSKEKFDLQPGDFLHTPAGDVHRVQYHVDTEFFIKWDGRWDILLDEDIETAKAALSADPSSSSYT